MSRSGEATGDGSRLRGGSSGGLSVSECEADGLCGVGMGRAGPLPLSLRALLVARSIMRSMAAWALLLSFTALPLTVWMRARCFRVVGDCRTRSVREGGGGGGVERRDGPGLGLEVAEAEGVGVECAM